MSTSPKVSKVAEDFQMPEDCEMAKDCKIAEALGLTPEMMEQPFDYRDHLTPAQFAAYVEQKEKNLAQLIESGVIIVADGERLHVNEQGFVTAVGYDVLPAERLAFWPPKLFSGSGGQENVQQQKD